MVRRRVYPQDWAGDVSGAEGEFGERAGSGEKVMGFAKGSTHPTKSALEIWVRVKE
jgi:hypothetical protein